MTNRRPASPQATFGAACAAFLLRETHPDHATAHKCHRAYVDLTVRYAAESGKSITQAAREISQHVRTQNQH